MHAVMRGNMRETGWSLSVVGVKHLKGVDPSKYLLLSEVIRNENLANNGGILFVLHPLITLRALVPRAWYN